jgi:hypothetical protein
MGERLWNIRQRGQALILGLVLLFAGALGLIFLFTTGQVLSARQRLDNAADAAALSAATWRARVFNFNAYANRAIVAQEIAVAQAVTLASWARYFDRFATGVGALASAYPPVASNAAVASSVATQARALTEDAASDEIVWRADPATGYKQLLLRSQALMHRSADTFGLGAVANEVARANDSRFFAFALSDAGAYERMTRIHDSDEDRSRLARMVVDGLDRFTSGPRGLDLPLPLLPSSCVAQSTDPQRWIQWYRKRGGTELSTGLDRWQAADTGSIHDWRRRRLILGSCRDVESVPVGWGAAEASDGSTAETSPVDDASVIEDGLLSFDPGGTQTNPAATLFAQADRVDPAHPGFQRYDGIARVRELDLGSMTDPRFPVSRVAVLARLEARRVRTAEAIGAGAGRLRLAGDFSGGRIHSLASAEVYFRRPPGAPALIEFASLYNPWWQARLVEPTRAERAAAVSHAR